MRPLPVLPAPGTATYADLEALPEGLTGELIDATLFASPRPAPAHLNVASVLGHRLGPVFHGRSGNGGEGGWWILDEPELHLAADVLVPDLAGWRRLRLPGLPKTAAFTVVPDWVCEVLSPSTLRLDRSLKLKRYADQGVRHAWLLDPLQRTLEVYGTIAENWGLLATHQGDAVVNAEPFTSLRLPLADLWAD